MALASVWIVGSGGREHALALRLAEEVGADRVMLAPGNPGAAREFRCVPIAESDAAGLCEASARERPDLILIGPEAPLAAGLADQLREHGLRVFGPSREAAQLESSKWFAKQVLESSRVPTAPAERFGSLTDAVQALERWGPPWVIKVDGLAAGKGVCVTSSRDEATAFLAESLERGRFGPGGRTVMLERFLEGEEVSVMAVTDGERHVLLTPARDFKRALDGDRGANTGGMGALAPVPGLDANFECEISDTVIEPVLRTMRERGAEFRGTLYAGLMLTGEGPRVIEFNVRFGDPETQVVLPLTGGSLVGLLSGAADGQLERSAITRRPGAAVAVALTDREYPERGGGGGRIEGLDRVGDQQVHVVHAATEWSGDAWTVSGGRAAYVVGRGADVAQARGHAYTAVAELGGTGWRCRGDIAGPARTSTVEKAR